MLIRREAPGEAAVIRALTAAAFARPGGGEPGEAALVDRLRDDPAWVPQLSLVALAADGSVAGHVLGTRGRVLRPDGTAAPVIAVGPLSVRPADQRRGVGSALMHAVIGAADALGEPLVALLGSTGYYPRFGFRPAKDYGITPGHQEWGAHFMVRPLTAYDPALRGRFAFAAPFDRV
jgi:putative acetyltransferase